ncbi:MAG: two-component response regulator [Myxococcales bacterium]|nr:two-component response regulator [Myxococcales bacterium]
MGSTQRAPRHVLIVEDDRVTALVLSEFLAAQGYRTSVATSGPDGLSQFVSGKPDLALVDALLPRMNGFHACYEMKSTDHGSHTPVVLMSAVYRSTEATARAHGVKAAGFLMKPFDLDVLLSHVHQLVGEP